MKHYNLFSVTLCIIAMSLFSCNTKETTSGDNGIEFDTIYSVQNFRSNNDSTQPSCNLKLTLIYPKSYSDRAILDSLKYAFVSSFFDNSYALLTPKDAVDSYSKTYIENYKEDLKSYSENSDTHDDDVQYLSYYETISDRITFNQQGIVAFQVALSDYKGGTSSYDVLKNYVFNLKTGKLVSEEDIFKPGYERLLLPIFKNYLMKLNKTNSINDLEELGYLGLDEMIPNNNFLVDDKGITYIFNKGEYSAYKLDAITIFIPYNEIEMVLKNNSPISQFIGK